MRRLLRRSLGLALLASCCAPLASAETPSERPATETRSVVPRDGGAVAPVSVVDVRQPSTVDPDALLSPSDREPVRRTLDDLSFEPPVHEWFPASAPGMLGDYFTGFSTRIGGAYRLDRLVVIANDLDSPAILPPGGSPLVISEPGPVGVYSTSLTSVQQLQSLLRAGSPLPAAVAVGSVPGNATMTSAMTVSQIQTLLGSTPGVAYDIVPVVAPPAGYQTSVQSVFDGRNTVAGVATYDGAASGALLQAGVDTLAGGEDFDAFYFYDYLVSVDIAASRLATSRTKIAQGASPLPQNRVYFQYGFFDRAPVANGLSINRYTPGFESTFLDGVASVEVRFPFTSTLNSEQTVGGIGNGSQAEFDNPTVYLKSLLLARDTWAVSAGLGVTAPLARDLRVRLTDGTDLARVRNEAVHLQPFLAGLYAPNSRFFTQGFLQVDVDANGHGVDLNQGAGLVRAGRWRDATYLFADLGCGYWVYQDDGSRGLLRGAAPMLELHYNRSLDQPSTVSGGMLSVTNSGTNVDVLNATVGGTFLLGANTSLSAAYVVPIGNSADQPFDGGLLAYLNYIP